MTELLIVKLDRLGAEAGIDTMTPEIRQFALLVRQDVVAQWPQRPWVELTKEDIEKLWANSGNVVGYGGLTFENIRAVEAACKEKNTCY